MLFCYSSIRNWCGERIKNSIGGLKTWIMKECLSSRILLHNYGGIVFLPNSCWALIYFILFFLEQYGIFSRNPVLGFKGHVYSRATGSRYSKVNINNPVCLVLQFSDFPLHPGPAHFAWTTNALLPKNPLKGPVFVKGNNICCINVGNLL